MRFRVPARIFLPKGFPPVSGVDRVMQADLGQVLRMIARQGGRALYQGELPHTVEADMKKNGGLLRAEDFGCYEVVEESPSLDSGFAKPLGIMVDPTTNRIRTGVNVFRISEARGI